MSREVISVEGLRADGRRATEVRKIECKLGCRAKNMDGAATYSQGNTIVMCSVAGPRESKSKLNALPDKCTVNVEYQISPFATAIHRKVVKADRKNKEAALFIKQIFEGVILSSLYPRSQISLYIHVIQNDGGARAAAINAATLALINAGIAMREFVSAATAGFVDSTPIIGMTQHNNRRFSLPSL